MTADERERRIRVRNARHATPDCLCDWCFILGRLDAERGKVRRVEVLPRIYVDSWDDAWAYDADDVDNALWAIPDQPEANQ